MPQRQVYYIYLGYQGMERKAKHFIKHSETKKAFIFPLYFLLDTYFCHFNIETIGVKLKWSYVFFFLADIKSWLIDIVFDTS